MMSERNYNGHDSASSGAPGGRRGQLATIPDENSFREEPGNLPLQISSFVGREREVAEIKDLLSSTRLLTLTGPGGCGKTRLALAVASDLAGSFDDGAWWVGLASLSEPELVPQEVASALEVRETPGRSFVEALADHIRPRKMLLVLDNCEHLIEACAELVNALLGSCPDLHVLATSREALGVAGERAWLVPPLSLPDPHHPPPIQELTRYEAVRLFVERAKEVASGFAATEENAPVLVRLCRRLDGMPLALELAAARVRVLSVEQIDARLDDAIRFLTGGSRTSVPRQQALRAAMDWSHDLLGQDERALFRRLSVFAGGFTLAAAEEICAVGNIEKGEVLDLLTYLTDKSLVLVAEQDGETRYRMLETIRQYGREKLEESGEAEEVRRRHVALFLRLAEQAEPQLKGREQVAWLERLETEHDNLRAAMTWLLERGAVGTVVRFAWALWFFWYLRGHQGEGYRYTGEVLEKSGDLTTDMLAKAICVRAIMSYGLDSFERTMRLFEESAALFRRVGNKSGLAIALGGVGVGALPQGDMERATAALEEGLKLYREIGDKWGISETLGYLGMIPLNTGDYRKATRHFEEALEISREIGNRHSGYVSSYNLALIARAQGGYERAVRLYVEGLRLVVEVGDRADIAYCIEGLAELVGERDDAERAARLFGASEALLEAVGAPLYVQVQDRGSIERAVEALRSRLDETTFEAAWAEGRAMTLEQAIDYALGETPLRSAQQHASVPVAGPVEAKSHADLRIFALGLARVELGGRDLTSSDWTYAKPKELLYYLLSHTARTKEQIGLALWPEASRTQLRRTFHVTLHNLRRALGGPEWVIFEKGRYSFNRSQDYWFDAETFEFKLAEARRVQTGAPAQAMRHLKEAVDLYGGDFLEDFSGGEWILVRQEELRRKYQDALLTLGRLLVAEGRHAEAAEAYRKAIAHDRYSEAAHRELMRCYARVGELGQALRHYEGLVELLRDEVGVQPATETMALYERLRSGEEI
jgi:predicted ATPase/DNA-binding SARP family transcriptional activator